MRPSGPVQLCRLSPRIHAANKGTGCFASSPNGGNMLNQIKSHLHHLPLASCLAMGLCPSRRHYIQMPGQGSDFAFCIWISCNRSSTKGILSLKESHSPLDSIHGTSKIMQHNTRAEAGLGCQVNKADASCMDLMCHSHMVSQRNDFSRRCKHCPQGLETWAIPRTDLASRRSIMVHHG